MNNSYHGTMPTFTDDDIAELLEVTITRLEARCDANKHFAIGETFARFIIWELREAASRLRARHMNAAPQAGVSGLSSVSASAATDGAEGGTSSPADAA